MEMKKIWLAVPVVIGVLLLSGCMSIMTEIGKSMYKDLGVHDSSVPDDQQCEIRFIGIRVKSFNGKSVSWGSANVSNARAVARNTVSMGHIKVPAGINTIIFDIIKEETNLTNTHSTQTYTEYTYTTTTTSFTDITFPNVSMLAGHNYLIGGDTLSDGRLSVWLIDMTNNPTGFYGDNVLNAPKKSNTPTKFEGSWAGGKRGNMMVFEFKGNTWELLVSPYTWLNYGPDHLKQRGTFTEENGILSLYLTEQQVGLIWLNLKPMKMAYIYNYSFEDDNSLLLELPFVSPEMRFIR
jgi:hypothetical protein